MGFPAQTVDGATVYIVSKTNDGGEIDIFTDADGREYVRNTKGGSQLALEPLVAEVEAVEVEAPKKTRKRKLKATGEAEVEETVEDAPEVEETTEAG